MDDFVVIEGKSAKINVSGFLLSLLKEAGKDTRERLQVIEKAFEPEDLEVLKTTPEWMTELQVFLGRSGAAVPVWLQMALLNFNEGEGS